MKTNDFQNKHRIQRKPVLQSFWNAMLAAVDTPTMGTSFTWILESQHGAEVFHWGFGRWLIDLCCKHTHADMHVPTCGQPSRQANWPSNKQTDIQIATKTTVEDGREAERHAARQANIQPQGQAEASGDTDTQIDRRIRRQTDRVRERNVMECQVCTNKYKQLNVNYTIERISVLLENAQQHSNTFTDENKRLPK